MCTTPSSNRKIAGGTVLQFIVAGLVLGGIYAISATGLVVTYQSAGILNFSFGAIAYTVARLYYFLNTQHSWPIAYAALLSILGLGPILGLVLYFGLFRYMRLSSTLVKVLATIGISVALPAIDTVIFGSGEILSAPGLAPLPVHVFQVFGVPVTLDQVIVYACVVAILVAGFLILRYTDVGLQIRALVDSPAMTALSGTNPGRMSAAVWAVGTTLAGLSGVLVAPIIGLDAGDITLIMVAAFAAVIAAKLRSLPIAAAVALGMGIVSSLFQYWLPPASIYTADLLAAIPFLVIAISLTYFIARSGSIDEVHGVGGALDRAITPQGNEASPTVGKTGFGALSWKPSAFAFAGLLALPLFLHSFWLGLMGQGVAYGVIFLSFSLVTGEGGMIWLCQATFAGAGGMATGLLTADHGIPILLSVLIGGLIAVPFGLIVGWLTIRMGDLYVALVTLTFGLLVENVVFNRQLFFNNGIGTAVSPPQFAGGNRALVYLTIGIFAVVAIFIVNLRRSTTGMGMTAVRQSAIGSKTLGISVVRMKIMMAGLAAFVAGVGGGLLAITLGNALTSNYATLGGEVWLVILVTYGIRSNGAAVYAGLSLTLLSGVSLAYLPKVFDNFVVIAFGLGAITIVKFPDGILTSQARHVRAMMAQIRVSSPLVYGRLKVGGAAGLVAVVVLIIAVRNLWWLWSVIALALLTVAFGYVAFKNRQQPAPVLVASEETPRPAVLEPVDVG
jgi:branched-chain amino acid transport system permease protein